MNITILGATGRVGRIFTLQALQDGHQVTALVRNENRLADAVKKNENFQPVVGDAKNPADISRAISNNTDIVFSALSTDKTTTLTEAVPAIIEEMENKKVERFISIGTAGILQARSEPSQFRFQSNESKRRSTRAAQEHAEVYHLLKKSNLTWTIFCPTYLPEGEITKNVQFDLDFLPESGSQITTGNTAWFTYNNMMNSMFFMQRVGLVEAEK
ncbi:NAD(P)-dependent oxidoreductase [Alkalicoccus daliensis]|uniref:Putative NADH-flavin reductase n=1 Tax=Alkalicoccus daliensis TaxID=745820 RepID=A0A1H0ICX0_9BACI|nr:NAD(P)H-binding protein [Alkalicoccus daliensis]SDO29287.1 Putative NADH-flavin reductase [Alkalicoccus daliensis]